MIDELIVILVVINNQIIRLQNTEDETPKRIEQGYHIPDIEDLVYINQKDWHKFSEVEGYTLSNIKQHNSIEPRVITNNARAIWFENGFRVKETSADYRSNTYDVIITIIIEQ